MFENLFESVVAKNPVASIVHMQLQRVVEIQLRRKNQLDVKKQKETTANVMLFGWGRRAFNAAAP